MDNTRICNKLIFLIPLLSLFLLIGNSYAGSDIFGQINVLFEAVGKAEQGDADAQFNLGKMYFLGQIGAPQDYKKAVYWFEKAADQGNVLAQNLLGYMYSHGQGVTQDYKKAVYWFEKAAEQGDVNVQYNLGYMYNNGEGLPQDYKKAAYWYEKAAEQGDVSAQSNLGFMYLNGKGVPQDYKKAAYWFEKAAEQGDVAAQFNLALMHFGGEGVPQDYQKAVYWSEKAAEQGHADAQFNLGVMHYRGKGVPQDFKKAVYWYEKAAEQGNADAQYNLGDMHYFGKGLPQNYKFAYVWLSLAAAQGETKAINNRDIVANMLSPQQLADAQEIASKLQYKIDHPSETQSGEDLSASEPEQIKGSGTGFFITKDGHILTCHHVIEDARKIEITVGGNVYPAKIIMDNPNDDLALLKIDKDNCPAVAFSNKRFAKIGQKVFTVGYPNPTLQGVNAKYTEGTINSLTGFQDDLRLYQVSVSVQPGNSGGALLDEYGNVVGIVVAMLDAKTTFNITGSLPQNVNYAVKSTYAQAMLDTKPEITRKLVAPLSSKTDVVDKTIKGAVLILCYD